MKSVPLFVICSIAFSVIGLLAAWGIGICAPTPGNSRPDFERAMFILLPVGGAVAGWFVGYFAMPFPTEKP